MQRVRGVGGVFFESRGIVFDLAAMLEQLRAAGVQVFDKTEDREYGHFGWAVDPEGNRFELWQKPHKSPGV